MAWTYTGLFTSMGAQKQRSSKHAWLNLTGVCLCLDMCACWRPPWPNLVGADATVCVQRLPPAQADLLLVAAAQHRLHRDGARHCGKKVEFRGWGSRRQWAWPCWRLLPSWSVSTSSSALSLRPSGLLSSSSRLTLVKGGRFRTVCRGAPGGTTSSWTTSLRRHMSLQPPSTSARPFSPSPLHYWSQPTCPGLLQAGSGTAPSGCRCGSG